MKIIFTIFFSIFALFHSLFATTVSGICKAYAGEKIHLVAYNDLFNELEIIEDTKAIGQDGSFSLEINNFETKRISLKIRDYKASFYILPKSIYEVQVSEFDTKSAPPLSLEKYLTFDFMVQDSDSLNYQIIAINKTLALFQYEFYLDYVNNRIKTKIPILESRLNIDSTKVNYVTQYKKHVLARQKLFARYPKKEVFDEFLNENYQPQNSAYIELFSEFYDKWFNNYISTRDMAILYNSIEYTEIDSLKNLLRENDFLQSEEVLEMVLAKELFRESLLAKKFDRDKLLLLLDTMKELSHFENVNKTCTYYINNLNKLKLGSKAPDFQLQNQLGNFKSLQDFKYKYVYIGFWSLGCGSCIKSMSILNQLYPKYKDSIEFVSVGLDDDTLIDQFVKSNNFSWTFLKGSGNLDLRKDYSVSGLPIFYFIGKDGTILQSPAESPGEGIELLFKYLFDTQRNTQEKIWDWNKPINNKK